MLGLRHARSQYVLLVLILLVAAVFRFYGLAWDSGYLFHPDERKLLLVVSDLRLPANILEFFSADSPLNPKFFAYGSFPIYLLKVLGVFTPTLSFNVPWREDFVSLALFGRALSALFDLGTIALIFLLGRRFSFYWDEDYTMRRLDYSRRRALPSRCCTSNSRISMRWTPC